MFKKLIFGLSLWLFATTLSFGANFDDGVNAYEKGDYKTALTIFEDLAKKGDIDAQYNLGLMYDNGYGVKQDYKKAFEWYEKAANQGIAKAQHNLGVMYERGQGVKQDYKKAFEWYEKSAIQGIANAQHNLGVMYSKW